MSDLHRRYPPWPSHSCPTSFGKRSPAVVAAPAPTPKRPDRPGRPPLKDRTALTGILFVLKTGIDWEDLPQGRWAVAAA